MCCSFAKLKLFKQEIILRNNVAKNYIQMLKKSNIEDLEIIQKLKKNNNVWAQFTIKVKSFKRAKLIKHLKKFGIPTGIYYPIPINKIKFFNL